MTALLDPDEAFVSAKAVAKLLRGAHASPEAFLPVIEAVESRLDAATTVLGSNVAVLIREIAEGEVPLGLPIRVRGGRREPLWRFLAEHSVFCPIHWRPPHVPLVAATFDDHKVASDIITLPIDQRMHNRHIRSLIGLLQQFFADKS